MQPIQKRPFQIIDKPTNVTSKLIDPNRKEINHQRNNFVPYYPKEYNPRELTQLFSFTKLNIVKKPTEINKKKPAKFRSFINLTRYTSKSNHQKKSQENTTNQIPQKQSNNRKLEKKTLIVRNRKKS